jgi:putative exporter of polyketide antibiotics
MKIAKPLLLIITPIGVIGGVREAYRFGGGLAILMVALLTIISVAMISVVLTIRRERAEEAKQASLSKEGCP